jgi:hypothetical protein
MGGRTDRQVPDSVGATERELATPDRNDGERPWAIRIRAGVDDAREFGVFRAVTRWRSRAGIVAGLRDR